jgi:putative FmdB family regulatory protein
MPTYDYICDSCRHEFEAFESIKADPQTVCPECRAETLRRKIGAGAAILFKGSGFYQTDYRSESYKKSAAADKPSESKPASDGASGGTKTESSPSTPKSEASKKPAASTSGTPS